MDSPRLPTIPEYFRDYVDKSVDLETTPSIPCPFHNEQTGKSFSYSRQLGIWRCFGACHCGGDVIQLHKLNYKLQSNQEAKESLYKIYGINLIGELKFEREEVKPDLRDAYRRRVYTAAVNVAKTVDDWLELDYVVSQVPYDVVQLEDFCIHRGVQISKDTQQEE